MDANELYKELRVAKQTIAELEYKLKNQTTLIEVKDLIDIDLAYLPQWFGKTEEARVDKAISYIGQGYKVFKTPSSTLNNKSDGKGK